MSQAVDLAGLRVRAHACEHVLPLPVRVITVGRALAVDLSAVFPWASVSHSSPAHMTLVYRRSQFTKAQALEVQAFVDAHPLCQPRDVADGADAAGDAGVQGLTFSLRKWGRGSDLIEGQLQQLHADVVEHFASLSEDKGKPRPAHVELYHKSS
eukprot:m.487400 g.487400  ORF g.487400 m.487400 type:complete len:154 (-) comp24987_c0_seq1:101-562(-)